MVCQKVKIKNPAGLHLRPAGKLCDEAIKYKSKISFQRGTMITNVKSLLSVLAAGIKYNDEIEFVCEGEDEEEALAGIVSVIQNGSVRLFLVHLNVRCIPVGRNQLQQGC